MFRRLASARATASRGSRASRCGGCTTTRRDICPGGRSTSCTPAEPSTTCRVGCGPDFWPGSRPPRVRSASMPISSSRIARSTWRRTSASITSAPGSWVGSTPTGRSGGMATGRSRSIGTAVRIFTASRSSSREELQHQAVDLGGVLVRGPVARSGNPVHVERANGRADLADEQVRGPKRGIVALTPEQPDPTGGSGCHATFPEVGQVVQERSAAADLPAVEAGATDAGGLNVQRVLGDAGRIAEHVDEQVVAADLAEEPLVVAGLPVAPGRPVPKAARGEATGRDQAQRSEEHTSELQSRQYLVCRLLLEKKKDKQ